MVWLAAPGTLEYTGAMEVCMELWNTSPKGAVGGADTGAMEGAMEPGAMEPGAMEPGAMEP